MAISFDPKDFQALITSMAHDYPFARSVETIAGWLADNEFDATFGFEKSVDIAEAKFCFHVRQRDTNGEYTVEIPITLTTDQQTVIRGCGKRMARARKDRSTQIAYERRVASAAARQKKIRDFTEVAPKELRAN